MTNADYSEVLCAARKKQQKAIADAASALNIKPEYLEAIESGDTEGIAGRVYLSGYIKSYANWLGLDGNELAAQFKLSQHELKLPQHHVKSVQHGSFAGSGADQFYAMIPDRLVLVLSLSLLIAVAIGWHMTHQSNVLTPRYHPVIESVAVKQVNPLQELIGKALVLSAKEEVVVTLTQGDNITKQELLTGDVMFVTLSEGDRLTADNPSRVEIFTADQESSFIGTLENVMGDS